MLELGQVQFSQNWWSLVLLAKTTSALHDAKRLTGPLGRGPDSGDRGYVEFDPDSYEDVQKVSKKMGSPWLDKRVQTTHCEVRSRSMPRHARGKIAILLFAIGRQQY